MINGVYCHETGCPDAWKDYDRACKWCGQDFKPQSADHYFCSPCCADPINAEVTS